MVTTSKTLAASLALLKVLSVHLGRRSNPPARWTFLETSGDTGKFDVCTSRLQSSRYALTKDPRLGDTRNDGAVYAKQSPGWKRYKTQQCQSKPQRTFFAEPIGSMQVLASRLQVVVSAKSKAATRLQPEALNTRNNQELPGYRNLVEPIHDFEVRIDLLQVSWVVFAQDNLAFNWCTCKEWRCFLQVRDCWGKRHLHRP